MDEKYSPHIFVLKLYGGTGRTSSCGILICVHAKAWVQENIITWDQ